VIKELEIEESTYYQKLLHFDKKSEATGTGTIAPEVKSHNSTMSFRQTGKGFLFILISPE
jgi:hypothetical protein